MVPLSLPLPLTKLVLRTLKGVAIADGEFHDLERRLIDAAQTQVLGTSFDLDVLGGASPEELEDVPEDLRENLLNACIVVALIDGEASEPEAELLRRYAAALRVESQALADVERVVHHHLRLARLDILRRSFIGQRVKDFVGRRGFGGMVSMARGMLGTVHQPTAEKYRRLELLAAGTLGRGYYDFVRANEFSFPGEEGGAPEPIVFHDCLHVLCGYDTTPIEETQIASFQAGVMKKEPIFGLIFVLAQFHLGIQITPVAEGQKLQIDPELMVKAFLRGRQVTRDLVVDWQPWDDFERNVDELRSAYGIEPR